MSGRALVVGDVDDGALRVLRAVGLTPQRTDDPGDAAVEAAELVVCPSEEDRSLLEQRVPAACGKTLAAGSPLQSLARFRPSHAGATARLTVTGADLHPVWPLLSRFRHSNRFEVRVDEWTAHEVHDETTATDGMRWADIVLCEGWGPHIVLAGRTRRPDQRLVVRLPGAEPTDEEWRRLDIDAVDVVVAVAPHHRQQILRLTGWPAHKVALVPNFVDDLQLARPKHGGARFHLGMLGAASSPKRIDLALDTLAELRRTDLRYTLFIKGDLPWDLQQTENRSEERAYFSEIRRRLDDPLLHHAVVFDPPGPDVAAWLQQIGFVLSTSDEESFHLAPAEGMASAAVPVIRPWPGAERIYDPEWIVGGAAEMARRILEVGIDEATWDAARHRAQRQVVSRYRFDDIADMWMDLLRPPA